MKGGDFLNFGLEDIMNRTIFGIPIDELKRWGHNKEEDFYDCNNEEEEDDEKEEYE